MPHLPSSVCVIAGLFAAMAQVASAAPQRILGEVVVANGRVTKDGSRIVTDLVIRDGFGNEHRVSQLGGRANGLGMIQIPGAPLLEVGDRVEATTTTGTTRGGMQIAMLESAKVVVPARSNFVRTGPTKAGNFLRWASSCARLTVDTNGTNQVAGEEELFAVEATINTWNNAIADCSYMNITLSGTKRLDVGLDYWNVLKFRDATWCRPATVDDPARCYPEDAAGLTTLVFVDDGSSPRDGEIVDADIELNGANFAISVDGQSSGLASCRSEVGNTLAHELGHFLGLEHTCVVPRDPPRMDHEGRPVPSCTALVPPAIYDATMFAFQECGEVKKESLEADDINAVCAIYPSEADPNVCQFVAEPTAGCCQTSGGNAGRAVVAAMTMLALFARRRRR